MFVYMMDFKFDSGRACNFFISDIQILGHLISMLLLLTSMLRVELLLVESFMEPFINTCSMCTDVIRFVYCKR